MADGEKKEKKQIPLRLSATLYNELMQLSLIHI